jgi:hypothetical protein
MVCLFNGPGMFQLANKVPFLLLEINDGCGVVSFGEMVVEPHLRGTSANIVQYCTRTYRYKDTPTPIFRLLQSIHHGEIGKHG